MAGVRAAISQTERPALTDLFTTVSAVYPVVLKTKIARTLKIGVSSYPAKLFFQT